MYCLQLLQLLLGVGGHSHSKASPEVGHAGLPLGAVLLGRFKGGARSPREGVGKDWLPLVTWSKISCSEHHSGTF